MTPGKMTESKVTETVLKFLESDLVATKQIAQSAMDVARDNKETTSILRVHVEGLNSKMDEIIKLAKESFVTKAEFAPVRKIVFGAVGIILAEFIAILTYLVGWNQ